MATEIGRSTGRMRRGERLSAQMFYDRYRDRLVFPPHALQPGMFVFWARPDGSIRHIEMVYDILTDGTVVTIGASGGGPHVKTLDDAIKANAFVQIRELAPNWVAAFDLFE